jgi:membrane protein implicated in regulation of membrane protease activity
VAPESVKDESGASKPRSVDPELEAEASSGQKSRGPADRIAEEFHQAVVIGEELIGCLKSYSELLGLELLLAFKSFFALLGSWLLLLPALLLTWLSLSALLAWTGYSLSGMPVVGFAVLFVMQLLLSLTLWFSVKRYRRRMTMSESRRQFKTIMQGVRNELDRSGKAKESGAKPPEGDLG